MDIGLASAPGKSDGMAQGLGTGAVQSTLELNVHHLARNTAKKAEWEVTAAERTESVL